MISQVKIEMQINKRQRQSADVHTDNALKDDTLE
jgi:hypothetical protein